MISIIDTSLSLSQRAVALRMVWQLLFPVKNTKARILAIPHLSIDTIMKLRKTFKINIVSLLHFQTVRKTVRKK